MRTITKAKIIDKFLEENGLFPYDLADYLEYEHDFILYKDSKYDDYPIEI